jgi:hypothetical protein
VCVCGRDVLFAIKASLGPTCTFSCFVTLDSFVVGILIRAEKKDEWVGVDKVLGTNNFTFVCAAQRLYFFINCNGHLVWCTAGHVSDAMRYQFQLCCCSLFVTSSCDSHRGSTRVCSECHEHLRSSSFSNKQWVNEPLFVDAVSALILQWYASPVPPFGIQRLFTCHRRSRGIPT